MLSGRFRILPGFYRGSEIGAAYFGPTSSNSRILTRITYCLSSQLLTITGKVTAVVVLQLQEYVPSAAASRVTNVRMRRGIVKETRRDGSIGVHMMQTDAADLSALALDKRFERVAFSVLYWNPARARRIVLTFWDFNVHL